MHTVWVNYGGDGDERERFADLATTMSWPSEPAGPDNRLRTVRVIRDGERAWYVKAFRRTQAKNRLRFLLTAPRAANDAQRELRVTEALRAADVPAPRPVAYGQQGSAAYYVCAELPGRSFAAVWRAAPSPALADAVARFCGALLARGFWLPDLAPDHVFVHGPSTAPRCAVLDLHNGRIARAGAPPLRLVRRVLRRFAKAATTTPVAPRTALRFAARLLRAAGMRDVRAALRPLPPIATAARYDRGDKSHAYAGRNPARDLREQALLCRVWPGHPGETVLDLPCGAGRLWPLLSGRFGHRVVQGDGAANMLLRAREAGRGGRDAVRTDALQLPFADAAVDGVVVFRFLHHLPPERSAVAIAEACRVARRFVVASFFHPCSFHHLQRVLWRVAGGAATRFPRTLGQVRDDFARAGFRLVTHAADLPFARDLWVATFVRNSIPGQPPPAPETP